MCYHSGMNFYLLNGLICMAAIVGVGWSVGVDNKLYGLICLIVAVATYRVSYGIYKKLDAQYDDQFKR